MTSLAVLLAKDDRRPAGLYIITDSRLTFRTKDGSQHWDSGQKTFASARTPDIFGFVGDASIPPAVLRQLVDQVNCGLLFGDGLDAERRHELVKPILEQAIRRQTGAIASLFSVFHGARDGELMVSRFRLWETRYYANTNYFTDQERELQIDCSYLAWVDGSGASYIKKNGAEWLDTDAGSTSRAGIWSFCNALREGEDPYSGGAPQLVGIWRKGPARTFGFWWNGKPYLSGAEVPGSANFGRVDWFNDRFERCDGATGCLLEGAKRHDRPKLKPSAASRGSIFT
jgi:hypothetical protein